MLMRELCLSGEDSVRDGCLVTTMTRDTVWCSAGSRPTGNNIVALRTAHLFHGAPAGLPGPLTPSPSPGGRRVGGPARRHALVIVRRCCRLKRCREKFSPPVHRLWHQSRRKRRRRRSLAGNRIRAINANATGRYASQFLPFPGTLGCRSGRRKLNARARDPAVGWWLRCSAAGMCVISMNYQTLSVACVQLTTISTQKP